MDKFTKAYLNVINEDTSQDESILDMFYNDVNNFVQHIKDGYGYILESELEDQFNRFTNQKYDNRIFDSVKIFYEILTLCEQNGIEVFKTEDEMFEAHPNDF